MSRVYLERIHVGLGDYINYFKVHDIRHGLSFCSKEKMVLWLREKLLKLLVEFLMIFDKYGLEEVYRCKEIVQSLDLYIHIAKHAPEFDSVDSYNHTIFNIEKIISEPYFVNYDKEKNSLQYYKKLDENVCAVVKLNLRKNKDCYVATVYPISETNLQRKIEKSYITSIE